MKTKTYTITMTNYSGSEHIDITKTLTMNILTDDQFKSDECSFDDSWLYGRHEWKSIAGIIRTFKSDFFGFDDHTIIDAHKWLDETYFSAWIRN